MEPNLDRLVEAALEGEEGRVELFDYLDEVSDLDNVLIQLSDKAYDLVVDYIVSSAKYNRIDINRLLEDLSRYYEDDFPLRISTIIRLGSNDIESEAVSVALGRKKLSCDAGVDEITNYLVASGEISRVRVKELVTQLLSCGVPCEAIFNAYSRLSLSKAERAVRNVIVTMCGDLNNFDVKLLSRRAIDRRDHILSTGEWDDV